MNNRAEAVKYLQSFGFYAMERTWVKGETIFVGAEPIDFRDGTPISFAKAVYIYPRNGLWSVDDMMGHPQPSDPRCVSLRESCDIAMAILQPA
jgi:hypothetical protein